MSSEVRRAPSTEAQALERLLDCFDEAWQGRKAPAIEKFLPAGRAGRRRALHELIKIDLEYRWSRNTPGGDRLPAKPRLEDYAARLPEVGPMHRLPLDLVGEEYRVRQRWGDRPSHAKYAGRFPQHGAALRAALARIDADLRDETPTVYIRPPQGDGGKVEVAGAFPTLPSPEERTEPPARRLGRYALGELLGTGSFGSVWRAWDTELGREVAVKLPRSGRFRSPDDEERFLREARSAAHLHHPGIVAVHDVGRDDDTLYIVSELVRGESLAERLRGGRPSFRESADLIAQVSDALAYAHRQGVVHRDVKPSNILLEGSGVRGQGSDRSSLTPDPCPLTPRLMDFGLALRGADEAAMTVDGQLLGTPAYMSPEQVRDPHAVDGRSDVYSLGVVLYELLTGELPFRGGTRTLLAQAASDDVRPPRRLDGRVPRDLETVCLTCLHKDPRRRYQAAGALAADLRRWLTGEPITARPVGRLERLWLWAKRNRALAVTAGLGAVALAAVTGAPAVTALTAVAVGSLLFALHKARTAADLAHALEGARADQKKSAAALQFALRHCDQARKERRQAAAAAERARRRCVLGQELARVVLFDFADRIDDARIHVLLVRTARDYLDGLAKEAGDDPALRRELAVAYARLGDVQMEHLSEYGRDVIGALASQRKSLDLFTALAAALPNNAQAQRDLEASRGKIADLERALGAARPTRGERPM